MKVEGKLPGEDILNEGGTEDALKGGDAKNGQQKLRMFKKAIQKSTTLIGGNKTYF